MTLKLQKIAATALLSTLFALATARTFAGSNHYGPQYATLPLSRAGAHLFEAGRSAQTMDITAGMGLPSSPSVIVSFRWIGQAGGEASGEIDPWNARPLDDVILSGVDSVLWRGLPAGDHTSPGRWYAAHQERRTFIGTDMTVQDGTLVAGLNMPPFIVGVGFGLRF